MTDLEKKWQALLLQVKSSTSRQQEFLLQTIVICITVLGFQSHSWRHLNEEQVLRTLENLTPKEPIESQQTIRKQLHMIAIVKRVLQVAPSDFNFADDFDSTFTFEESLTILGEPFTVHSVTSTPTGVSNDSVAEDTALMELFLTETEIAELLGFLCSVSIYPVKSLESVPKCLVLSLNPEEENRLCGFMALHYTRLFEHDEKFNSLPNTIFDDKCLFFMWAAQDTVNQSLSLRLRNTDGQGILSEFQRSLLRGQTWLQLLSTMLGIWGYYKLYSEDGHATLDSPWEAFSAWMQGSQISDPKSAIFYAICSLEASITKQSRNLSGDELSLATDFLQLTTSALPREGFQDDQLAQYFYCRIPSHPVEIGLSHRAAMEIMGGRMEGASDVD